MKNSLFIFFICITLSIQSFSQGNDGISFFIVAKDGTGDFVSIQEALNSIPKGCKNYFTIFIKNGNYNEKIFIEHSNIIICGESRVNTIIEFAELRKNWKLTHDDDYGSAIVNIKPHISDIIFKSITIKNNYGSLYGDHDHAFVIRSFEGSTRIILDDCAVISDGGDALSLWNTDGGMYYHHNCFFEGWVDYVCPRGYCLIEDSKFYGHNLTASIWHDGSKNEDYKFVIKNSYFDGVENFPLGRFHRDAQFYLIDCIFSHNMADKQIFFAPSNPPRILQWGEDRIYFSDCKVEGKEYNWLKDNLEKSKEHPAKSEINSNWVFAGKWDPISVLKNINDILESFQKK
ncbi:MAG: pectin esterase [Ignavibacteriales bacterium]|nr:pectin esterase [Ignavibacteriales bacterium]